MNETARRLLQRLPILLVAIAIAWLLLGDRPRERHLVYDLPASPHVVVAEVSLRDATGAVVAELRWGSAATPAQDPKSHRPLLKAGSYLLRATLQTEDGAPRVIERSLEIGADDEQIVVHL